MIRDLFEEDTLNAPVHRISLREIDRRAARIRRRRAAWGAATLAAAVAVAGFVTLPGVTALAPDATMAQPVIPTPGSTVYMLAERSVATPGTLNDMHYPAGQGPVQIFVQCPGFQAHAGVWVNDELVTQGSCGPITELRWNDKNDPDRPSDKDGSVKVRVRAFPYTEGGTLTEADLLERAEQAKDYRMGVIAQIYRYPGLFVPAPADCAQPLVVERPSGSETLQPVNCE